MRLAWRLREQDKLGHVSLKTKIWSRGTHCPHWGTVQRQKVTRLVPLVLVKQDWECQLFGQSHEAIAVTMVGGAWPLLLSAERLQKVLLQGCKNITGCWPSSAYPWVRFCDHRKMSP